MTEEVTLQTSKGAAKERDGTDEPDTPAEQSEPDETSTGSRRTPPGSRTQNGSRNEVWPSMGCLKTRRRTLTRKAPRR
jgi:hypothetical protein